ncbi:hypothetical protein DTO164E3_4523 [Paecilomyces variotii]|nr:hypothetical protein DTO164E3_4523 [Paecilomyces variotii]KAJ9203356.1 hypothetical protein DTO032I3_3223 [Paecilomyces variotii]KAJ9278908.1 hypothetical protein DTO021D3_4224 [Paecilomyces variotii]KAJ9295228.1 hypothetical protein DTO217A2_9087 [Paecilomyces variotii]KAJ9323173.1 hypothetical protein DTO027B3_5744 [Paecilomyces variotii]
MLPTPSTSHVSFDTIYEPAEDSFLFLDTLSSASETAWLSERFSASSQTTYSPPPLVVEVGTGSGVVLAFAAANAKEIFGQQGIMTLGTDVNLNACAATQQTVITAIREKDEKENEKEIDDSGKSSSHFLASLTADLCSPLRPHSVDVLLFNPPYVPTPELPRLPSEADIQKEKEMSRSEKFEHESYLLSLTYAGGADGMEITNRLLDEVPNVLDSERGVAYVLLCAQNKPEEVKERIRAWGHGWMAETVGRSGMQAGWEKLVIVRIWRDNNNIPLGN